MQVCVFHPLNAWFHLNIIGLFACHFPPSHSVYKKLHRLAEWVTEAFIKIRMIPDENIFCWKSRFHADYTPNIQGADTNRSTVTSQSSKCTFLIRKKTKQDIEIGVLAQLSGVIDGRERKSRYRNFTSSKFRNMCQPQHLIKPVNGVSVIYILEWLM